MSTRDEDNVLAGRHADDALSLPSPCFLLLLPQRFHPPGEMSCKLNERVGERGDEQGGKRGDVRDDERVDLMSGW